MEAQTRESDGRRPYTVAQFADEFGINRNTVYNAIKEGQIPHIRIGRLIFIPRPAAERLLNGDEV